MWEVPSDVPEEFLQQLDSEHRIKHNGKWIWERIGSRANHFFDCCVMDVAMAVMLKLVGAEAAETGETVAEDSASR